MRKKILDRTGMQIYLAILFSVIGTLTVMIVNKGFNLDMSKLQKAIMTFSVTSVSILLLFPRFFKIPFGKQTLWEWLRSVGVFAPSGIVKQILLGILLGAVSLTGMFLGSYFTGKYEFSWSNLSLGHFIFSLTPGIWEEIMFRGVLMIILIRHYKSIAKAFWLQTAIFAVCHITGFTLGAVVEVISVFIIGLTFSFVALRTRALIAGIIYHYIHDAFLFLVQNPNGEYFGFTDNATFYLFLWAALLVNLMIIILSTKKLNVKSPLSPYEFDGIVDKFGFFEHNEIQSEKANKLERFSLIAFMASFVVVIPKCFEDGLFTTGIILSILLILSFAGFIFYNKFSKNMMLFILFLNSIGAILTGQMMSTQGSTRVYLIYYLIGFLYLTSIIFIMLVRSESIKKYRFKP